MSTRVDPPAFRLNMQAQGGGSTPIHCVGTITSQEHTAAQEGGHLPSSCLAIDFSNIRLQCAVTHLGTSDRRTAGSEKSAQMESRAPVSDRARVWQKWRKKHLNCVSQCPELLYSRLLVYRDINKNSQKWREITYLRNLLGLFKAAGWKSLLSSFQYMYLIGDCLVLALSRSC